MKNIACSISYDIQSNIKKPWPLASQDIINSEDTCHRGLCNLIAWTAGPSSCMVGDVVVRLSKTKSTEMCRNVEVLVANAQPILSQALLSLFIF